MLLVLGIFLGLVGLLMLIAPSILWSIVEQWKSNNATDPSEFYVWNTRFGGIICVIVSILCFYAFFL